MQFIHDNSDSDLTIDGLASRFYMSRAHMMRLFKRETGYTIGGYINEKGPDGQTVMIRAFL
ncbi:MAG: AraC family transcriptional regulator [Clostridium sp.]